MDIFTGYGMSETCPILTLAHLKPHMRRPWDEERQLRIRCKTGLPIPLVDLRIVDEDDERRAPRRQDPGEIVVRARG
jgi:fatty-acyl-CoA synthase